MQSINFVGEGTVKMRGTTWFRRNPQNEGNTMV